MDILVLVWQRFISGQKNWLFVTLLMQISELPGKRGSMKKQKIQRWRICSPMGCQSYWLPQPCRYCIISIFKSISGHFTYRSSPCYHFFVIQSVSELSYSDRPLTQLFRLRRGPQYTFKSKHTLCHSLCNFSFHKGRPSASSGSIFPCFASAGCPHRRHCWSWKHNCFWWFHLFICFSMPIFTPTHRNRQLQITL